MKYLSHQNENNIEIAPCSEISFSCDLGN